MTGELGSILAIALVTGLAKLVEQMAGGQVEIVETFVTIVGDICDCSTVTAGDTISDTIFSSAFHCSFLKQSFFINNHILNNNF